MMHSSLDRFNYPIAGLGQEPRSCLAAEQPHFVPVRHARGKRKNLQWCSRQ